jgi:hypothetical protein
MKDVREVLNEKLRDLTRVTREINALRIVIPLVDEGATPDPANDVAKEQGSK